jgi:hypothetical protein
LGAFGHRLLHHLRLIDIFVFPVHLFLIVVQLLAEEGLVTDTAESLCMVAVDPHSDRGTTTGVYDR